MRKAALMVLAVASLGWGSSQSPALSGKVSSQAEGAMAGVIVGAKRAGSTMSVWVVSNAQGQYTFPRERLEPGKYAISIRAVGYELPKTSVDVTDQPAHLDLQLDKVTRAMKLATQFSNAEFFVSIPGTPQEKRALGNCVTCHTLHRVLFSRFEPQIGRA